MEEKSIIAQAEKALLNIRIAATYKSRETIISEKLEIIKEIQEIQEILPENLANAIESHCRNIEKFHQNKAQETQKNKYLKLRYGTQYTKTSETTSEQTNWREGNNATSTRKTGNNNNTDWRTRGKDNTEDDKVIES